MSRRTDQLASILHEAIQGVIQEGLADPRAAGMATITSVKVTDDLSQAVINVSIFPEKNESLYMHALEDAGNYIRREVADRVALHRPPQFLFRLDRSLKRQAAVFNALSEISSEKPPANPADPGTPGSAAGSADQPAKESQP